MPVDLDAVHEYLIEIARRAGQMILEADPLVRSADTKKNCATPSFRQPLPQLWTLTRSSD